MSAPCHWHEDLEWIHILEGTMCYDVNGRRLVLGKQDSLMVNARRMHYGYSFHRQDCRFLCVLFHPSLFCSNQSLMQRYVEPVLKTAVWIICTFRPAMYADRKPQIFSCESPL